MFGMARIEFPEDESQPPTVHEDDGAVWMDTVSDAETARVVVAAKPTAAQARGAANMRIAGAPWDEIAAFYSYKDPATARAVVEAHIAKAYPEESRDALRRQQSIRLDYLWRIAVRKMADRVEVREEGTGDMIEVQNPEQNAWVKTGADIVTRFNRLHGLDAPQAITISPDAERFEQVVAMMAARERGEDEAMEVDIVEYGEIEDGELDG